MTPDRSIKARVKRLDRIAGEMNAWLLVIAIGRGVLNVVVMAALHPLAFPVDNASWASADRETFDCAAGTGASAAAFGQAVP